MPIARVLRKTQQPSLPGRWWKPLTALLLAAPLATAARAQIAQEPSPSSTFVQVRGGSTEGMTRAPVPAEEPSLPAPRPLPSPVPELLAAPKECRGIGMNSGPGVVAPLSLAECTDIAPLPDPDSGCQCVVSVRTRRREIVRPDENRPNDLLFQECNKHYGHPSCPADPANNNCGDGKHSAPYGNWGVRVRNAQLPASNPLLSAAVSRMSGLQDCQQWPGTADKMCGAEPCKQWHSCTCDQDLFTAGHFGDEPPPGFVSQGDALAGFFVVDSGSITCQPALNLKDFTFQANLELFELDSDASDFITTLPVSGKVRMTCGTIAGCTGAQEVQLVSNRVRAMARIEVSCDNRLEIGGDDDDGGGGGGGPTSAGLCEPCGASALCSSGLQCFADNICHRLDVGLPELDECIGANLIAGPPSPAPLQVVVSPPGLAFSATLGAPAPPAKQLSISSNRSTVLPAFLSSNQPWLKVSSPGVGVASVSIQPAGLAAGSYSGAVIVSSADAVNSPLAVPVSLTVASPPPSGGLTVSPASLGFTAPQGGPAPAPRVLQIGSTGAPLNWSVSDNASFVNLSPITGVTPGATNVSINVGGLPAGTYNAAITVSAPGVPQVTVPVSLTVTSPPPPSGGLTVSPASLSFSAPQGGPAPSPQVLQIGSTGAPLNWSASDNAGFVNLSPIAGVTPGATNVSINVGGLTAGTYSAAITVSAPGVSPVSVPVFLTVGAVGGGTPVVNGFSPFSGPPGTQVEVIGDNFTGVSQVLFNFTPAPFQPSTAGRLFATVPSGATTGPIKVTNASGTGASFTPFTVTPPGGGPSIALFSPLSGRPGDRITIQGANFRDPSQVFFNGAPSPFVLFAGPNFLSAEVPQGASSGPITVTTSAGSASSAQSFVVTP